MGITHTKNGVIGVAVTIREDTRPDWFRVLQTVSSGQARAELLRAHLGPPPEHFSIHRNRGEEGDHDLSPEQGVTSNSYNFSTANSGRFGVPEKFSGASPGSQARNAPILPSESPVTASSYNFSTAKSGHFDMPEKFSGAQTGVAEQAGVLPSERADNANSYNFSTGNSGRFDVPEKFSGPQTAESITEDDENAESLAELLVRTRQGGL